MDEQNQTRFEGFALVEIMGHRRAAGMVTTEFIGTAAFLRIVTPEVPPTEYTLEKEGWVEGSWVTAGSVVSVSRPKSEILVGAGSIYAITPIEESDVLRHAPVTQKIISIAPKALLEDLPASNSEFPAKPFSNHGCPF